ncbi:MAG: TFIIB-type zinc ribbon-containing protein [Clostridia bacterium]|nr:TFIIB-type zinc ribbon-containing protein [Clostridia bacterium]
MAVVAYKCPCCGAGISFNSELQKFKCEYCLSAFTEEEIAAQTPKDDGKGEAPVPERAATAEDEAYCAQMKSYVCDNCGAEVFADENTVADFCYYCHNPVVCSGRLEGQLTPKKIVPFAFDKAEAENRFLTFARSKKFAPRNFFSEKQAEKILGIYFPFWLTDADVSASLAAKAERVRTWISGKYSYTETSYYAVHRAGDIHFEDVTTGAYDPNDKKMLEGILPFPSEALRDFSMPYLSGFLGKKRIVEQSEVEAEVNEKIRGYSNTLLMNTVTGYTSVHSEHTEVKFTNKSWDYALMPVYILTYKKGDKTYLYALNGHTGKVYGEIPISGKKLLLLTAIFMLIGAAVAAIGGLIK